MTLSLSAKMGRRSGAIAVIAAIHRHPGRQHTAGVPAAKADRPLPMATNLARYHPAPIEDGGRVKPPPVIPVRGEAEGVEIPLMTINP